MMNDSLLRVVLKYLPIEKNEVCFSSFSGLYNDNPLYISQELHRINPSCRIVWILDDRCKEIKRIPKYIRIVKYDSIKALLHTNRAKVIVGNYAGNYFGFCKKSRYYLYMLLKNKRQFDLSTWHGTPLKKIGFDTCKNQQDYTLFSTSDLMVVGNRIEKNTFSKVFLKRFPLLSIGSPRNDILYRADNQRIKKELGLDISYKYALFAPTFRDLEKDKKSVDLLSELNTQLLVDSLEKRFGGKWRIIVRGHQMIQRQASIGADSCNIVDGNTHDDMAKYMVASDILITDCSSSLFDYMLTDKPCFLFFPDYDNYISKDRGIYGDIKSLPYDLCKSNEELSNSILNYNDAISLEKRTKYRDKICFYGNGHSSLIAAKLINEVLSANYREYKGIVKSYVKEYGVTKL